MKNIKQLFLPYELAVIAKEKGFNERNMFFWSIGAEDFKQILWSQQYSRGNQIDAPLYQQIINWLREKHNICASADGMINKTIEPNALCFIPTVSNLDENYDSPFDVDDVTPNYYDALNEAILEAFKLIK